jgi:hypothetical protein
VAALIEGADAAVKAASVQLLEIRMAMALGGKAFLKLSGEVAAVEAAVEAGAAHVARRGLLVNKVVIPAPSRELFGDSLPDTFLVVAGDEVKGDGHVVAFIEEEVAQVQA